MSEPLVRKRGMIDMLGIACAVNYFYANKLRVNTKRSIHKIPLLFEEFKISDIYYNNYRIDVITLYKEKTVKIPKIHIDLDIMPHFYFVVQIGAKIKEAKMIGFIDAKSVSVCSHDSKFYYPTLDLLFDIRKFVSITRRSTPARILLGKHIECMGLFLKFMDNDLSSVYKKQLIQHLMSCDACRERFIDVMSFEKLAGNLKFYPDLLKKCEINRLNAQANFEKAKVQASKEDETLVERLENNNEQDEKKQYLAQNVQQTQATEKLQEMKEVLRTTDDDKVIVISSQKIKQKSKKIIDSIFNEIPKIELPPLSVLMDAKNKRKAMVFVAAIFVLLSFVVISCTGVDNSINDEITQKEQNEETMDLANLQDENDYLEMLPPSTGEARLIPKQRSIEEFTINAPQIAEPSYTPQISKVSWEAPESLVKKDDYTKYLQLIGKNIKLNLQNDLLLVNDIPMNKTVRTDIKVAASGDIHSINIIRSSGSEIIDSRIEKTVNETMTYMKPPSHGILSRPVNITLTIELH